MAFNIFGKKKKEEAKPAEAVQENAAVQAPSSAPTALSSGAHEVILSIYVSEKTHRLMAMNQYVFKVAKSASAREIAKHVGALYKVKVKTVQVLNMPEKSRNVGRHSGTKSGFKKAIITLAKGQVIGSARP